MAKKAKKKVAKEMASNIGNSVLGWYVGVEDMLQDVLQYVPYCPEHKKAWSPKLVTILHEVCSQLDSLWFHEVQKSSYVNKRKPNITDYRKYFGERIAPEWVVFWGEEPERIRPFKSWDNQSVTSSSPEWWVAYQLVKHNRLANKHMATLEFAVNAVAGLFLAIRGNEDCWDGIAQLGWLSDNGTTNRKPQAWLGKGLPSEKRKVIKRKAIAVESKLFSHPVGWSRETIGKESIWTGSASPRFIKWFNQYESAVDDEERHEKLNCLCCKIQKERPRRCPICDHVFQGNGWNGIDAHWRSNHEDIMPYEKFWESLCSEHMS